MLMTRISPSVDGVGVLPPKIKRNVMDSVWPDEVITYKATSPLSPRPLGSLSDT